MGKFNQNGNGFENSKRSAKDILREIVDYSYQKEAYLGHRIEGEYLIAYMVEKARILQYLKDGLEVMEKLQNENAYIGIAVHSTSDLRFIQNLIVMVTLIDESGHIVGQQQHYYHPRPGLQNYRKNWVLPGNGVYTLRAHVDFPDLKWGADIKDNKTAESVEVDFPHVMIKTGQHVS